MVFACVMEHRRYFNVEADNEEQMMEWLQTHDASDVDNLTKDYTDEYDERIYFNGENCKPHFSIATKYYPVYSEKDDITFIMKETTNKISVCGFYFGEPDEDLTKEYTGKLTAEKNLWVDEHLKGVI